MSDWREQWEDAASTESKRWREATTAELIAAVRARATGEYYGVWKELARRTPSAELCWALVDVLESDRVYLDRYHCADALIALLHVTDLEAVALSAGWPEVPANVQRVRRIVESTFGARP